MIMNIQPNEIDVLDLLPQRAPFIMVDKLTHYDLKSAKTIFTVRADNLFCFNDVMEEAGLVENIAQTCAARTGFKQWIANTADPVDDNDVSEKGDIKIGVIGMINMLEMKRCPMVGETLETSMEIEEELFSTTFVRSEVTIAGETIATCRMKLFLTDKTPDR